MNWLRSLGIRDTEIGRMYLEGDEIEAARQRGEPLIELSAAVLQALNAKQSVVQELLKTCKHETFEEMMARRLPR